jgi:HEAT repeats
MNSVLHKMFAMITSIAIIGCSGNSSIIGSSKYDVHLHHIDEYSNAERLAIATEMFRSNLKNVDEYQIRLLNRLLQDDDSQIRCAALMIVTRLSIPPESTQSIVLSMADHADVATKSHLCLALQLFKYNPDDAMPILNEMLDSNDLHVKFGSIRALKLYGSNACFTIPKLVEIRNSLKLENAIDNIAIVDRTISHIQAAVKSSPASSAVQTSKD